MINSRYDKDEKLATADITMFMQQEDQSWKRSDVTLTQRAYSIHEIFETLAAVGFIHLEVFDAVQDFNLDQVGRAFFRAKKR